MVRRQHGDDRDPELTAHTSARMILPRHVEDHCGTKVL
jgi:hypothetical protein